MKLMTAPKYYKYPELEDGFVFFERAQYLETSIDQKYGNPKHLFKDLDTNEIKCLNGAGQLNYCIDRLSEGDICKIVFKGKIKLTSGKMAGKDANQFEVYVEDSAKQETAQSNPNDLE